MELKLKYSLWATLLIFLISNIMVILVFKNNLAEDFVSIGNSNFDLDATMLLSNVKGIFMPGEPFLPKIVSFIRDASFITGIILSAIIVHKSINWKNLGLLILLTVMGFIMFFIQLDIASPGIYDFFRKVKASYTLGVIATPWLYYYLVVLIPTIFTFIIVTLELLKMKNKR